MFLTRERVKAKLWIVARLSACALAAVFFVAASSRSRADVWDWLTDLVQAHPDTEPAALSVDALPPDAIVTKGGETRVLRLGRDILELYPSTAVAIEQTGPDTSVRLITGTVRVTAAKRKKGQAFNVRTLLLVATVKGTEFEVSATGNGSAVSVYEGRVAVKATGRVGGIDVTPGKTATVTSAEDAPTLGPTPAGGAAAATKALGRASQGLARPPAARMMATAAAATARTSTPPPEALRAKAPAAGLRRGSESGSSRQRIGQRWRRR